MRGYGWIERSFQPEHGLKIFGWMLGITYGFVPIFIYFYIKSDAYFLKLSILTCITLVGLFVGSRVSVFDNRFGIKALRFGINLRTFQRLIWGIFIAFIIVTFLTAPSIPLFSAIKGASADALSQERGDFLKSRAGAEIILLYASTFLVNTVVPYSTVLLYATNSRFRYFSTAAFFFFCISFLQKALFLNLALPLIAYLAISRRLPTRLAVMSAIGLVGVLILGTYASRGNDALDSNVIGGNSDNYLSALYVPKTPVDYFIWRSIAVPVFTASDTLLVHAEKFNDDLLYGATSTLIATIFDMKRINVERYVFEYQFGGWNEIANSNSVFIIDAYVNFGYIGVLIFALFVGQIFRWFRLSKDIAFKSLWPLFAFVIFSAPLIGMLFSNGFIYMLFHALLVKIRFMPIRPNTSLGRPI